MKTLFFTVFILITGNLCLAQGLWINDPQTRRSGPGTIEETKITYEPRGLFMHVDWEITFTGRDLEVFEEKDTLEAVYNFNLPEGAVINDSWLWFGDTILKALILDRWSASQVYEGIVNRRKDPSILTKNWGNSYELRIFPMAAKESRKVKISFLTPANWTPNSVKSHFLSENLLASKNPIKSIDVYARLSAEWKNPLIPGEKNIVIPAEKNDELKTTHYRKFSFKELLREQEFEVSMPLNDGYYLDIYEKGNEQFYQLAMFPAEGMDLQKPQKVLFLIDFHRENTELSQPGFVNHLAMKLKELLNEKDSFNILFYDLELKKVAEKWIPGDSASIEKAINTLAHEPFPSYSTLPSLLSSGIEYAKTWPDSKFILLANSDKVDDVESANALIDDLMKLMDPVFPIFIGDFQAKNFRYNWINNYNYRGNEYFYRNLAKLTGGDYCNTFEGDTFAECMYKIYQRATNDAGLMDIHTTLDNGFCYGRYILSDQLGNFFNNVYLETGRFSGDFPFEVDVSGLYDNNIFTKSLSIEKQDAIKSDSLTGTFWYGNEILEMEGVNDYNYRGYNYNYSVISDIIDKSIEHRILSNYTAFLALEPGMMGELENIEAKNDFPVFRDPVWDGALTGLVSKEEVLNLEVNVYPNPFSENVNIEINLPEQNDMQNVRFEIYDLFGKRIKVFDSDKLKANSTFTLRWDTKDNSGNQVPKGTYLFICSTTDRRISKKLFLM